MVEFGQASLDALGAATMALTLAMTLPCHFRRDPQRTGSFCAIETAHAHAYNAFDKFDGQRGRAFSDLPVWSRGGVHACRRQRSKPRFFRLLLSLWKVVSAVSIRNIIITGRGLV